MLTRENEQFEFNEDYHILMSLEFLQVPFWAVNKKCGNETIFG